MFLIQFNLFYNNFIYNCICLIRGLSNNNFLCRAVGVSDDVNACRRGRLCQTYAPQVVPFGNAVFAASLNTVNSGEFPILVVVYVNP